MANNISYHKVYLKSLDEIYKTKCLTSVLDTEQIDSTKEAKTFTVDILDMDGLSDYDRANGYTSGSVTLKQEEKSPNYDRGKKFEVDEMDDVESGYIAFGKLSGEFERTKVIPEIDAFRLSKYAQNAGLGGFGSITTAEGAVSAIEVAEEEMTNNEVSQDTRYVFMTPNFYNLLRKGGATRFTDVNTDKVNRKLVEFDNMTVVVVPVARFYSICNLGTKGYTNGGVALNFLIIEKSAIMQYQKHKASNVINPEDNQNADAYILKYRNYGLADVYDNKKVGLYVHALRQEVKLFVKAVDGEEGTELAGATVVAKQNSSSGTSITANADGSFTIPTTVNKVYVKVTLTGYEDAEDVFDIDGVDNIAGKKSLAVELEASV